MFQGVFTAIVTPFKNDKIDYDSYFKILDIQIKSDVTGIVPCGTTGESPTLSHEEHEEFIRKTVEYVNKRKLIIAGTGSNSTREAIRLTERACKDGVDGVLSVNPYYNKPGQKGLYEHFKQVAEVSSVPVMLYNIPGRTGVNLLPATILKLSKEKNIRSVKEASGNLQQMAEVISLVGDSMTVLSGDDSLTLPLLSVGGKGIVSVVSNAFPSSIAKMTKYALDGKYSEAREIYYELFKVFSLAFCETNPIPIKAVMSWLGYCENNLRLPLTSLSDSTEASELKKEIFRLRDKGFE
ncbi:MAG: 4-hydroxy-tetrahydrodipicolinate synthase [Leptospiraceae bacterium]|nr:4-hydroxy-tetrahydrodipicolinate synthase [Leptospiraceae bacterium]MCP5503367.1 4-hydroxy-tetrahydrodipicolinate synthase [Leptospiraceae bacterium]